MDNDNDKIKVKAYTREKTSNSNSNNNSNSRTLHIKAQDNKTPSHPNSNTHTKNNIAKDLDFEKYKINPLRYKNIRDLNAIRKKLNNTVNHRNVSPLGRKPITTLTPVRLRLNSQMISNLPLVDNHIQIKSQTPPPYKSMTKNNSYNYSTITPYKACNSITTINIKDKHKKKTTIPNRLLSPSIDMKPNANVRQISNFRTQIFHLNKTIESMKMENEKKIIKKDEEIGLLMQKLSEKHEEDNYNKIMKEKEIKEILSNSIEPDQILNQAQHATIELLDIKLKDTQKELNEYKQLIIKQKALIDMLNTKIIILQKDFEMITIPSSKPYHDNPNTNKDIMIITSTHFEIPSSINPLNPHLDCNNEKLATLVQTIKQSNPISIHKDTLLTQSAINEISFLLRKIFEVNNLSLETIIYHLFENDTEITFENIVNKYQILTNNNNPQNKLVLLKYFETLSSVLNEEYANLDLMKRIFIEHMQKLRFFSNKEAIKKKAEELITILLPHKSDLEKEFDAKDIYSIGLISHEAFVKIIEKLNMKSIKIIPMQSEQYELMIFIMKQFHDENCDIYDLNYRNLIALLNKPQNDYQRKIILISKPKDVIVEWLSDNKLDFNTFMKPMLDKAIVIEQKKFVYTDQLTMFLKENKVLNEYEIIDKEITSEIIDVNDLGEYIDCNEANPLQLHLKPQIDLEANNAVKDNLDNDALTKNFVNKIFEDALASKF